MEKDLANLIMNPARQRIIAYLLLHRKSTTNEISAELPDIPRPSIYRHVRILEQAGLIKVAAKRQVRGTVEKTYELVKPAPSQFSQEYGQRLTQNILFFLAGSFARYFAAGSADLKRDMLGISSVTLLLSDEEFREMTGRIGAVYQNYITNKPNGKRMPRCLTFISSPTENKKGE